MKCVKGKTIGKTRVFREGWQGPGPCMVCGVGPLHGPFVACDCSYWRAGQWRLCKECAVSYDWNEQGFTLISDPPFANDEVKQFLRVYKRWPF